MKIQTTKPFDEDYRDLPESIKERADRQFVLLIENPRHPSLALKKIKGHPNIWEGRVTGKSGTPLNNSIDRVDSQSCGGQGDAAKAPVKTGEV